jgi:hypothetical protein
VGFIHHSITKEIHMGKVKTAFHYAVAQQSTNTAIFLLMEGDTPITAYADKALAEQDCWVCNDAQRYLDMEQLDYWVKPVGFYFGSPDEA